MADETRIIEQSEGDRFRLALEGQQPDKDGCTAPILHDGHLVHEGRRSQPLVHLLCWDEDAACVVRHGGEVTHVGDPERPVPLEMRHSTPGGPVALDVGVQPMEHRLTVGTGIQDPIHHALQLQTPLQVRFIDPWEAASDYRVSIRLGSASVIDIRLTGKTLLTPRGASSAPCAGKNGATGPRVQAIADLLGHRDTNHD